MDQFWPATAESFLTASPPAFWSLRPLLDQCLLMKGISGVPIAPFNGAFHAQELSIQVTAQVPDAVTRNQINISISADQPAANYVGGLTSLKQSQHDEHKRDEYLDSVRLMERRIAGTRMSIPHKPTTIPVPNRSKKVAAITSFNISQFAYMVKKLASLREGEGNLLDNCIMMQGSGLEDGNKHVRENLPFIVDGKGGVTINTGKFPADAKGNQMGVLTNFLACAGVPLDRPFGIATKQMRELMARGQRGEESRQPSFLGRLPQQKRPGPLRDPGRYVRISFGQGNYTRSNRSRFITLVQAATKSWTNLVCESAVP